MNIKIDNLTNKISFGLFKKNVSTPLRSNKKLPPTIPNPNNDGKLDIKA